MKKLFLLAGEISGDTHGSGLMRSLREREPQMEFLGYGGVQMRGIGGEPMVDWVEDAGVVGLWEVLKMYGWFKQKMAEALAMVAEQQPDAVVLIDYPGFNLRFAKALREQGYAKPLIYYISPQVWAWKKGRIKTMAKLLDLMICIFPFEKVLYEKSGLPTVFAGHPMVDRVKTLRREGTGGRDKGLVGFFPGSRANEVKRLLPVMLETATRMESEIPGVKFVISAANARLATLMGEMMEAAGRPEAKAWIETGTVYDLMQRVEVGAVASGTATLEAACFGLPYVLVYKVNGFTFVVGKAVVKIKFLGMINILAGCEVVKELVQGDFNAQKVATELGRLMKDAAAREGLLKDLAQTVALLGEGGAYDKAADAVLEKC
ncbi:lipid-A-disaccharide synthase [Phragmitibacter flavus]|uniref:Lipid-A-disaccharide synthase n=1 Tax=Phragmitibacter flavus TaxID=2576071 RepID=A0A5R8K9H9_9BACT|nr:lipid-A-disaccharide synthase [Phragmitibacter flavus]TLD68963.1 lipid-A-disaccharide synthase [Phragmitibacter flavus]